VASTLQALNTSTSENATTIHRSPDCGFVVDVAQHGVDGAALWNSDDEMNVVGHDRVAEEPIAQAAGDVHPFVHSVIGIGHLDQRDPPVTGERAEVHGVVLIPLATH